MHTFSASFPITNHPSNSNCSFLTGPCVDTQSFGNVTSRPEPAWEHTDEFFPAALAPVLLSYNYISACAPNKPKKCRSIKDSTSRTSNTFRAVQGDSTSPCTAEQREAETRWCAKELCGFEPTLNHHIYLKQG